MTTALTFGLLGLAIIAVWSAPYTLSDKYSLAPWMVLFGAAVISGVAGGLLTLVAVAELAVFATLAYWAGKDQLGRAWRIALGIACAIMALALALHRLPGFHNPQLIANVRFSPDAIAYTQYANFDKAAVGLILLAFLCRRARTREQWGMVARRTWPIALATLAIVMSVAVAIGMVRPEWKLPDYTPIFLATNLLFTCVAEEAFFRGLLQERMARAWPAKRAWQATVVALSGVLFGLAHLGGGQKYALLAILCGLGYAYAYARCKRIEAAIATHFAFNAIHFVAFTYPAIAVVSA